MRSPFRPEPRHVHGSVQLTAVVLVNLGTPEQPTPASVRRYLAEFLSDPRVVELPRTLWKPILHGIILRTRPRKSALKYASIWTPEGSPLKVWTERQTQALRTQLAADGVRVEYAMRYGSPALADVLDRLKAQGATRMLVLPLYPQYCAATTGSVIDALAQWVQHVRRVPELRIVNDYHDDAGYLDALSSSIRAHWAQHKRAERLLLSFHGMPARTLKLGDPYHCACLATARLLAQRLGLRADEIDVTFQSRFGRAAWLQPYTEPRLVELARSGVRSVDVVCPGFVGDCIETLEEISMEARAAFMAAGGQEFHYIPCLNDSPAWIDALLALVRRHLSGWPLQDTRSADERLAIAARAQAMGAPGASRP